jgi:catechol 2,3-dioxygenase-like lactoylglutathione lyase family enzyme/uncharacterized glyoxalase superfamily protein PhnB
VAHYREVLGFRVSRVRDGDDDFAIVELAPAQGVQLKRGSGDPALGAYVYMSVEEVERAAAELIRRDADVRSPLALRPWQMRELWVADPAGHRLRVGADPAAREAPGRVRVVPEIPVADVNAALAFSCDVLGFENRFSPPCQQPDFGSAWRGGARLHWTLAPLAPARNRARAAIWDVYIEVQDVEALASELGSRGAAIARGPVTTAYGMRELEVAGPEGVAICFAEEARP